MWAGVVGGDSLVGAVLKDEEALNRREEEDGAPGGGNGLSKTSKVGMTMVCSGMLGDPDG